MDQNIEGPGFQQRIVEPARDAFREIPHLVGFSKMVGPYSIVLQDGLLRTGFEVGPEHCNPNGVCHGGALATFLDTQLAVAGREQARLGDRFLLTVNLSVDFLAAPRPGDWIVGRTEVIKRTGKMVFAQGLASVAGIAVGRASGVFRISPLANPQ